MGSQQGEQCGQSSQRSPGNGCAGSTRENIRDATNSIYRDQRVASRDEKIHDKSFTTNHTNSTNKKREVSSLPHLPFLSFSFSRKNREKTGVQTPVSVHFSCNNELTQSIPSFIVLSLVTSRGPVGSSWTNCCECTPATVFSPLPSTVALCCRSLCHGYHSHLPPLTQSRTCSQPMRRKPKGKWISRLGATQLMVKPRPHCHQETKCQ